ncbi:MAG: cofactor-independent phosphoglycerate mutase [Candidatus Omnitrophota bacterium]|nr:MAG: cofactor-independent phosphoglycerate mutase [Candidatus Omnitrophota bacterium]
MKYIIIIPDGMADYPCEKLFGKTPLEVAKTPFMDAFCAQGKIGLVRTIPRAMEAASDIANLSILGYDPARYYPGRGPLEASNLGVELEEGDIAFRCNLVTVEKQEDRLIDYSAGHISSPEAEVLISKLNKELGSESIHFYAGVSYRHLLVIKGEKKLLEVKTIPPHNIIGERISENLPAGEGAEVLIDLMNRSYEVLKEEEVNAVRIDLGENPANMVWFWGQGEKIDLPSFEAKFGLKGAVISAVDLIKGIGKSIGFEVIDVEGATGYYNTNYQGKGRSAISALEEKDLVYVHIEAPDEAGHNGEIREKIKAIEEIDQFIVGEAYRYSEHNPARVLILPDHFTPVEVRKHCPEMVPFIIAGEGIEKDEIDSFSESNAQKSRLRIKEGWRLMEYFLT